MSNRVVEERLIALFCSGRSAHSGRAAGKASAGDAAPIVPENVPGESASVHWGANVERFRPEAKSARHPGERNRRLLGKLSLARGGSLVRRAESALRDPEAFFFFTGAGPTGETRLAQRFDRGAVHFTGPAAYDDAVLLRAAVPSRAYERRGSQMKLGFYWSPLKISSMATVLPVVSSTFPIAGGGSAEQEGLLFRGGRRGVAEGSRGSRGPGGRGPWNRERVIAHFSWQRTASSLADSPELVRSDERALTTDSFPGRRERRRRRSRERLRRGHRVGGGLEAGTLDEGMEGVEVAKS
jgi:hypothetical protein